MKVPLALPPASVAGRLLVRPTARPRARGLEWTCASCRRDLHLPRRTNSSPTPSNAPRPYSSSSPSFSSRAAGAGSGRGSAKHTPPHPPPPRPKRRIAVLLAASGGAAAATGLLAFTDDIKQSYEAVERTGRVASALFICINDYRNTLKQRDNLEDPEERETLLKGCHKRCAVRTLKVLEKNGGIFIKLGQHLSAMNYLLPSEWTTTFIPLQDRCPVSSLESIEAMFRSDLADDDNGATELGDVFSDFSREPIGAASLAQVHLATLRATGQRVAVKVQHPSLAQWAPLDLALTRYTFATVKRFFPEYDLEWLSRELDLSLPQELDFRLEADNAARMRRHFEERVPERLPLLIPDVVWAKRRILVMKCESGRRLDDLEFLDREGIDRDEVSAVLARIFNEMIFGDGAPLHCDPHGGNIAIRKVAPEEKRRRRSKYNFEVILYDHGLYRDIPRDLRRAYAKMWLAVIEGDVQGMRRWAGEVAGVTDETFPLFASAITGRDFLAVLDNQPSSSPSPSPQQDSDASSSSTTAAATAGILAPRSEDEKRSMSGALQDGLLADLVQLLGKVPRVILLIIKTNDLTRSLDENLQTRQGPVRSFLILARYCSRAVFQEQVERIREMGGSLFWPPNALRLVVAWAQFVKVEVKLEAFELWIAVKRVLGLDTALTAPTTAF